MPFYTDPAVSNSVAILRQTMELLMDTMNLVDVSMKGLDTLTRTPALVKALAIGEDEATSKPKIDAAVSLADFAQREMERGYPFLVSQATIAIWGQLEAFVEDLCARVLEDTPSLMASEEFAKVKISIAQYLRLEGSERYQFIVQSVQRDTSANLGRGAGQFESLLQRFGLGGSLDEPMRKTLMEMWAIRNVLVHRKGVADRRLIEECQWLGLSVGSKVTIPRMKFMRYWGVVSRYVAVIFQRLVLSRNEKPTHIDGILQATTILKDLDVD